MIVEIVVYLFIAVFIGISQVFYLLFKSAGIGGGPILNISLIVGLGYDARYSMNVTYIFLMGGALASMWKNKTKKNANGYPVIDYNLVLLTLPAAISGSLFGVI